jgi:HEPN domain-containing protein
LKTFVARDLLKSKHYSASCFHSQQAAEKAVKAALLKNRMEARGHSILMLLKDLEEEANIKLNQLYEDARMLDRHYAPPDIQIYTPAYQHPHMSSTQRRMPKDV